MADSSLGLWAPDVWLSRVLGTFSHFPLTRDPTLSPDLAPAVCRDAACPVAHPPPCFSASWPQSRVSAQPGAGWGYTGSRCCGCRPACDWRSPRGWSAAQRAVLRTHIATALQYPPENRQGQVTAHARSSLRKPPEHLGTDMGNLWLKGDACWLHPRRVGPYVLRLGQLPQKPGPGMASSHVW